MRITGAFAPVPTPLTRNGAPDAGALAAHLQWLAGHGLDGALILGSNGEFPSFTLAERLRIAAAAAGESGRLALLLGVGSCALDEVLTLVAAAADLGYAGALCPPPFYLRPAPVAGVAAFLGSLLDHARLPVLLYHIPQLTGVPLADELLDAVGERDWLAGVKDSSGDAAEVERLARRFAARSYLVGNDRLVAAALAAGGSGSITAAASVAPELVAAIRRDPARQPQLNAVRSLLEECGLIAGVKAILRARGLGHFGSRPPMVDLEAGRAAELVRRFDEILA